MRRGATEGEAVLVDAEGLVARRTSDEGRGREPGVGLLTDVMDWRGEDIVDIVKDDAMTDCPLLLMLLML